MKTLLIVFLFSAIFTCNIFSQTNLSNLSFADSNNKSGIPSNYYSSSHRWTFEYGLLLNATAIIKDAYHIETAHIFSAAYDFNLSKQKLFGSIQLGFFMFPPNDEHKDENVNIGPSFSLGLNYSVYTEKKYNFSIFLGGQLLLIGGYFPAAYGVAHLRNSVIIDKNIAFTIGIKYMPRLGMNEHWVMPTIGFRYFLN